MLFFFCVHRSSIFLRLTLNFTFPIFSSFAFFPFASIFCLLLVSFFLFALHLFTISHIFNVYFPLSLKSFFHVFIPLLLHIDFLLLLQSHYLFSCFSSQLLIL